MATRRRRAGRGRRLWWALDAFAAAMVLYLVLRAAVGDRLWPVFAGGYVAHLLLPAAALPLPLALLRRRWGSLFLEAACAAAFVWLFRDELLGHDPAVPPPGAPTLTVLTYNLGDGLAEPDELVPLLRDSGADLVGLQEVTPEVAAAVEADLRDAYPHQAVRGLGIPGKALLSRYPIVAADWLEFAPDRPDLRAVVEFGGSRVTVVVAHPPPPRLGRTGLGARPGAAAQFDALVATFAATDGPLVVLGDFNVTTLHDGYRDLESAGLRDAYREAGPGFGFTTPTRLAKLAAADHPLGELPLWPLIRIDYVWVSSEWVVLEAWVGSGAGSDHLPVLARLALPSPAPASAPAAAVERAR